MLGKGTALSYAVIATLGPSSREPRTWAAMLEAGATAFRLNTSHLLLDELAEWMERLELFLASCSPRPALSLDLQGSKWRVGHLPAADLHQNEVVEVILGSFTDQVGVLPVPHADFFRAVLFSDGEIVLNDAKVRLVVEESRPERVRARVIQGGPVAPHKGVTFANTAYRSEALSDKDRVIVERYARLVGVQIAISYVRDAAEMERYRRQVMELAGGQPAHLIAKLERGPAVMDAAQIARHADELWVCRGDLGAEVGLITMAAEVHRLSAQVRDLLVPVIMAGQVLEHMTASPTPTRSEVCYLYDALALGYAGFVLSDEAAVGQYPVESCRAAAMFQGAPF